MEILSPQLPKKLMHISHHGGRVAGEGLGPERKWKSLSLSPWGKVTNTSFLPGLLKWRGGMDRQLRPNKLLRARNGWLEFSKQPRSCSLAIGNFCQFLISCSLGVYQKLLEVNERHLHFLFPELTSSLTNMELGFVIGGNVWKWANYQESKLLEPLCNKSGVGEEEQGGRECVALLPGPREKGEHSGHWRCCFSKASVNKYKYRLTPKSSFWK